MLLSVQSPTEVRVFTFPKHSLRQRAWEFAAERLAFTAGLEDEGKILDASLSNSDTAVAFVVYIYWRDS